MSFKKVCVPVTFHSDSGYLLAIHSYHIDLLGNSHFQSSNQYHLPNSLFLFFSQPVWTINCWEQPERRISKNVWTFRDSYDVLCVVELGCRHNLVLTVKFQTLHCYWVCLKSKTLCICQFFPSSSQLFRNIGKFWAKKYFTDHQRANKIQLFVAIKGNFSTLLIFWTNCSGGKFPWDYSINVATCLFAH